MTSWEHEVSHHYNKTRYIIVETKATLLLPELPYLSDKYGSSESNDIKYGFSPRGQHIMKGDGKGFSNS